MIDKKIIILSFSLLTASVSQAGKYAVDFLRIGVGARSAGLGGAYVALVNDATSFYWNPAGLTGVSRFALHVDHTAMFNGLSQYNAASAALALRRDMTVSLSWVRLGVDDIPRYAPLLGSRVDRYTTGANRSDGQAIGSFSDAEDAFLLSFAKKITFELGLGPSSNMIIFPIELSFGVSGKYVRHQLDDKVGLGQGIDAGIMARTVSRALDRGEPTAWYGLGLAARDLSSTSITWNTASKHQDQADAAYQLGMAASYFFDGIQSRLTLALDQEFGDLKTTHAGVELNLLHVAAVRLGTSGSHISAGAGLQFHGFHVDYAFVSDDLANNHRVSLAVGW
jgi:hypothetical protein